MSDPQGLGRIADGLRILIEECRSTGSDSAALERALAFFGTGSSTEFLGESLLAIESWVASETNASKETRQQAIGLARLLRSSLR